MTTEEKRKIYQQNYKKYHYKKTRKVVEFPLLVDEYNELKKRADKVGVTANKLVKDLVLDYLENRPSAFLSEDQKHLLQEYMRISRGIATNINQMAHSSNVGETIDIAILINSLKHYEDEFKNLVSKMI